MSLKGSKGSLGLQGVKRAQKSKGLTSGQIFYGSKWLIEAHFTAALKGSPKIIEAHQGSPRFTKPQKSSLNFRALRIKRAYWCTKKKSSCRPLSTCNNQIEQLKFVCIFNKISVPQAFLFCSSLGFIRVCDHSPNRSLKNTCFCRFTVLPTKKNLIFT